MSAPVNNLAAQSVKLRKFDMKMIPQDAVCVFIGRRRTGKSTLVKDLLFQVLKNPTRSMVKLYHLCLSMVNIIKPFLQTL